MTAASVSRRRWAILGWTLAAIAAAYLTHIVWQQRHAVAQAFSGASWGWLAAAVAAFTVMALAKAAYHCMLVAQLHTPSQRHPQAVASSFLVGQLLRYLPGKVWGLVYQAGQLRDVCPTAIVIAANGIQMAIGIAVTSTLLVGLLGSLAGHPVAWLALPLAIVICVVAHRHLGSIGWLMTKLLRQGSFPLESTRRSIGMPLLGAGLLVVDWLFFVAGFIALGAGTLVVADAAALAIAYAGASIMAMFAVAVPAGLGVREALFVSTAELTGHSAGGLIVVGILARLAMTAGDMLAALAALVLLRAEVSRD